MRTPGKARGGIAAISVADDVSFLGSEEPRQAYQKVRERLIELEIEKEEQEKQL